MSEPHVITALVRKRGQLAGEIESVKNRLDDLIASLETIDDAIRVFDPDYAVVGIRPIEFRARSRTKRGELPRMLLDILREAGRPMTAPEIVAEVMKQKGMDGGDGRLARHMTVKVNAALRRHRAKAAVRSEDGPDVHLIWSVGR